MGMFIEIYGSAARLCFLHLTLLLDGKFSKWYLFYYGLICCKVQLQNCNIVSCLLKQEKNDTKNDTFWINVDIKT